MLGSFAWNILVVGSTQGSLFLTHLIVARLLGVTEFGRYALLLTTAMAVSAIAQSGIGFVAAKYIAEFHLRDKKRAGRILNLCRTSSLTIGSAAALILFFGADGLATLAFGLPDMAYGLRIIGLAIPFLALNVYQQGALQGFGEFRSSAISGAAASIFHVLVAIGAGMLAGLPGVLWALALSAAFRVAVFAGALRRATKRYSIQHQPDFRQDAPLLWRAGLPSALMGVSFAMSFWLVNLMLARGQGGTDAVAHFYAANQIRLLALQAPMVLSGVSVALLNRLRGEGDWAGYRAAFSAHFASSLAIAGVITAIAFVLAPFLMSIYGTGFAMNHHLLQVMLVAVIPEVAAMALYVHVQAHERLWSPLCKAWIPKDAVFVFGTWSTSVFGPLGAALAYVISWLFAAGVLGAIAFGLGFGPHKRVLDPDRRDGL